MYSSDVPCHVFVRLECGTTVVTGVVSAWTVGAQVVMICSLVVVCFVAHRTQKTSLSRVYDQVVAIGLGRLEPLTTLGTYILTLVGVNSHMSLEVLLGRGLVSALWTTVSSGSSVLEHPVNAEADLLCEGFIAVWTCMSAAPGCHAKVHMVKVHLKFTLGGKDEVTL